MAVERLLDIAGQRTVLAGAARAAGQGGAKPSGREKARGDRGPEWARGGVRPPRAL
ncbi:MAG: hypothetical protein HYY94_00535 [Gemmatimonadetes bacterium]|nr:hypothetical protein [Gemmatimonadota bacterium]